MAAAIIVFAPRYERGPAAEAGSQNKMLHNGRRHAYAFPLLVAIGIFDSATRMGFLLFLPFVLTEKGASLQTVGLAMTLVLPGAQ